jgi:hypothetical protein
VKQSIHHHRLQYFITFVALPLLLMYIELSSREKFDIGHRVDRQPVNFIIKLDWCCRMAVA